MAIEDEKAAAGRAAATYVQPGMKVGLGTGSTIFYAIEALAERWRRGELDGLTLASTSERTTLLAHSHDMQVHDLSNVGRLDLTIDGADEVDPQMNLIKGLGGALLREKI